MIVTVGYPKVLEVKGKGWKYLHFPILFNFNEGQEGEVGAIVVKGFRLQQGNLLPPCTSNGRNWFPVWGCNFIVAGMVYEAVKEQGKVSDAWRKALVEVGGLGEDWVESTKALLYNRESTRMLFEQ